MVSPALKEYVDDCARQSCLLADVRNTLLATGWPAAEVDEALSSYGQPAVPEVTKIVFEAPRTRRTGLTAVVAIGGIILLLGVPTAFAEQGYLPVLSKTYRSMNLSVAWNGLAGTPSLAMGEMVKASAAIKAVSVTSKGTLVVSAGTQSADGKALKGAIEKGVAFLRTGQLADVRSFASISADGTDASTSLPAADYSSYLPLTLSTSTTFRSDATHASDLGFSVDLGSVMDKIPALKELLSTIPSVATGEIISDAAHNTAFLRSNVLPYKAASDKDKWFSYPLGTSSVPTSDYSPEQLTKSLTSQQLKEVGEIIDGLLVDRGIERVDGRAEAHYQAVITTARLEAVKMKYPENSLLKHLDLSQIQGNGSVVIDIWVGEFDHLPYRLKIVDQGPIGVSAQTAEVSIQLTSDSSFAYDGIQPIAIPVGDAIIQQDMATYLEQAYQQQREETQPQ